MDDCFHLAYMIKDDLEMAVSRKVPKNMMADSESLFKIMLKSTTTTENRLIMDVRAAHKAFENGKNLIALWIEFDQNAADVPVEQKRCEALDKIVDTGMLQVTGGALDRERYNEGKRPRLNNLLLKRYFECEHGTERYGK